MTTSDGFDGTRLAYHSSSESAQPLVVLPGGPMLASAYFGDLGGLAAERSLLFLDLRGTGDSATPADHDTYRCERQVDDIEALRVHLGMEKLDLASHSAGASLAVLYAARYPDRIASLTLITPSVRVVGVDIADDDRRDVAEPRRHEPWFAEAFAAFERIWSGQATDDDWSAIAPFSHGRWDVERQEHMAREAQLRNDDAAAIYYSGEINVAAVRAALADVTGPVLLVAGEYDVGLPPKNAAEFAGLFPNAQLEVVAAAGHFPWLDNPQEFVAIFRSGR